MFTISGPCYDLPLPILMDLLTADLLIPLLPTLATMATLSLEGVSEFVRVMGPGVDQFQPVNMRTNKINNKYLC